MFSTRYKTHVANAYHKTVYVNMGCDQSTMKSGNFNISAAGTAVGGGAEFVTKTINTTGFTGVGPRSRLEFTPDVGMLAFLGKIVYVTAFAEGESRFIADAFPIQCDRSIIIKADGNIATAEYGSIWVDEQGDRHGP